MGKTVYDLIVVGAGPAGSMAAYFAAKAGLRVLLLDKSTFPRNKPCAGGLTTKVLARLPFSIESVLETTANKINIGFSTNVTKSFSTPGIICGFVVRKNFDSLLLNEATKAGAIFKQITKIEEVERVVDGVRLLLSDGTKLKTKYLVAADGANSQVRKLAKPQLKFERGFALEGVISKAALSTIPEMTFDFGVVDFGYGWMFPKRDHINIGLFTNKNDVHLDKGMLRQYAARKLCTSQVKDIVGFPLGFGGKFYQQSDENILFAGDAAGLAEPLLGEGIFNAIMSGEIAGTAVAQAVNQNRSIGQNYNLGLKQIRQDLVRCQQLADLFYPHLERFGYGALTSKLTMNAFLKGFAAGKTTRQISNWLPFPRFLKPVYPGLFVDNIRQSISTL